MESACKLFGHKWNGRICKRCGAIRNGVHEHIFVPMKDECAEECTICGEQRVTEHDWHSPPSRKSDDGTFIIMIGQRDICRTCGAKQYAKVKLGYAECDASVLTPLERKILYKACDQLAESNLLPEKASKADLQSVASNFWSKRLYFNQNTMDTVKLATSVYLSELSERLKETEASPKQDSLLLEYLTGIELLKRLKWLRTGE